MSLCGHCGNAVADDDEFCARCGHQVVREDRGGGEVAVNRPRTANKTSATKRVLRDEATQLLDRLAVLGALVALVLWLWHLAVDAQLGIALPHHSTLRAALAGTPISAHAQSLGREATFAFAGAVVLGGLTEILARDRAFFAKRWGKLLLVVGVLGIIYSEALPPFVATHPGSNPSRAALNGILRTASPALDLYIALAAVGFALYSVGWFVRRLAFELRHSQQLEPRAPAAEASGGELAEAPSFCDSCGESLEGASGAAFCPHCGSAFPAVCPSCGGRVGDDARFCAACGCEVGEIPASLASETVVPVTPRNPSHLAVPTVSAFQEQGETPALSTDERPSVESVVSGLIPPTPISSGLEDLQSRAVTQSFPQTMWAWLRRWLGFSGERMLARRWRAATLRSEVAAVDSTPQPAVAPMTGSSPNVRLPLRTGITKRAVTEEEARMCVTWARGGVAKKLGLAASVLLFGFGIAATTGNVPAVAEVPLMILLVPLSLGSAFVSRGKQRALSEASSAVYAVDVSGVPEVHCQGTTVTVSIGDVSLAVAKGQFARLTHTAAGSGQTSLSCVVVPGKGTVTRGLITANAGQILDPLVPARVVGV